MNIGALFLILGILCWFLFSTALGILLVIIGVILVVVPPVHGSHRGWYW